MRPLRPLLGLAAVQSFLKRRIERNVRGPDATSRDKTETLVWGEAMNAKGEKRVARVRTPNVYSLTVDSALALIRLLLERPSGKGGFLTPSQIGGKELLESLPGVGKVVIGKE